MTDHLPLSRQDAQEALFVLDLLSTSTQLTQAQLDLQSNLRYLLAAPLHTYAVTYQEVGSGYRIPCPAHFALLSDHEQQMALERLR